MLSTDAFVWTCCVKILGKTKNIIVSGIIVELKRRRGGVYSFHFFEKSFDKKKTCVLSQREPHQITRF